MLSVPEHKFVVSIPDFSAYDQASSGGGTVGSSSGSSSGSSGEKPNSGATSPDVGGKPVSGSESAEQKKPVESVAKELLTKGSDNTVPALPTLSPKEEGNVFEGWVNKATGEAVKKGDKLTENIEIVPVWKDCGEGSHVDENGDNRCDKCGYITVKEATPEDTTSPVEDTSADTEPTDEKKPDSDPKGGVPGWMLIVIICIAVVIIACCIVLVIFLRKKK